MKWKQIKVSDYTPFTLGLRLLCLHCATTKLARSPLKAERRPNGCLISRSRLVHRTFRPRHGRHVQNSRTKVAEEVGRSQVAQRRQVKARASPWLQNGNIMVGHWSSRKNAHCCTHCVSIWATLLPSLYLPPLCFLWPTNSVYWAITVATIVPPFGDHGSPLATLAMVLPPLCLLS